MRHQIWKKEQRADSGFCSGSCAGTCRFAAQNKRKKPRIPESPVNRIKKKRRWQWADIWKRM